MKFLFIILSISNAILTNGQAASNQTPTNLFAKNLKADYENGKTWSPLDVLAAKEQIINNTGPGTTKEKDVRSIPVDLGYHSLKVEKGVKIEETINLSKMKVPLDIAILVDDNATIEIKGQSSGFSYSGKVMGTAIWNPKSFQQIRVNIPPGDSYTFTIVYNNTANLTKKYGGEKDIDGIAVYLYPSQPVAVDLDIDSNNNEGMNFDAPGSEIEDEIEVDPSLPGKYVFAN
ncbi:MAG: hypothetical protein ACI9SQ_001155, partial [Rubritalea sp.]